MVKIKKQNIMDNNIKKNCFSEKNNFLKLLKNNNFFILYAKKCNLIEYYQDTVYYDKYNNDNSKNSYNDGLNESSKVLPKVFWKISTRLNYKFFSYKWFYNSKSKVLNKRSFNFFNYNEKFKHNVNIYLLKEEFYKVTHDKNLTLVENNVANTVSYAIFNKRSMKIFFKTFFNQLVIHNKNNIYISFAKYFFYILILKLNYKYKKKK